LLRETGLRSRVRLSVDGGLKTGRDVAVAALLGAEEYVFGTASLVTAGCVMARVCHTNDCPTGVATQRPELRERFAGDPDHVVNYVTYLADHLRAIMADLGFRSVEEMVGRVDCLRQREVDHPTAGTVDLSGVLAEPSGDDRTRTREQDHDLSDHLDRELIDRAEPAVDRGESVRLTAEVGNDDRTVGAMLSNRIVDRHGTDGLADETVTVNLTGTAGQSFGAFLASGVSLHLAGSANDYVGKGLSGGRLTVAPPADAGYGAADVAIGNVALYGATDGELYVNGRAGERFAVRNSGATAVLEGVGDHGCEYMTGGAVAVLGPIGRNFAAGMSGGVAYVYDPDGDAADRINTGMASVGTVDERDERLLRRLVENHAVYTGSERAERLLADWERSSEAFVKILPDAYRRAVDEDGREDVRDSPPAAATRVREASPPRTAGD
jgi:glutamate synthase (NADPH/NADH) large chain